MDLWIERDSIAFSSKKAGFGCYCGAFMPDIQNGCSGKIEGWPYLSHATRRGKRKYYHPDCALRLHVVTCIPESVKKAMKDAKAN